MARKARVKVEEEQIAPATSKKTENPVNSEQELQRQEAVASKAADEMKKAQTMSLIIGMTKTEQGKTIFKDIYSNLLTVINMK